MTPCEQVEKIMEIDGRLRNVEQTGAATVEAIGGLKKSVDRLNNTLLAIIVSAGVFLIQQVIKLV